VALFQRPVTARTVLTLGSGELLDGVLREWTEAEVRAAVQLRLGGLLSWHSDATVSAHPLVRDTFRPLALTADSAMLASDLELADLPAGRVGTREHAQRLVEIIELLLEADQWDAANELFSGRSGGGGIWKWLPAVALGQRCALAFVATPERQRSCLQHLSQFDLGYYLSLTGPFATSVGDLVTAEYYSLAAVDHTRRTDDQHHLSLRLQSRSHCLAWTGDSQRCHAAANEALNIAAAIEHNLMTCYSHAYLAWAFHLAGRSLAAEEHLLAADRIEYGDSHFSRHLVSLRGCQWGRHLLDTGRPAAARRLTEADVAVSLSSGWNEDVARGERLLAGCELADGRLDAAASRVETAVAIFRDGDMIPELGDTLVVLTSSAAAAAFSARRSGHAARRSRSPRLESSCRRSPARSPPARASAPTDAPPATRSARETTPTTPSGSQRRSDSCPGSSSTHSTRTPTSIASRRRTTDGPPGPRRFARA
jgi:hypothetical protein